MSTGGGSGPTPGLLDSAKLVDLDVAWREREQEARELIAKGHESAGLALLLYSLEIRVKTRVCKHLKLTLLPKACKTHDLSELIVLTGLFTELQDPSNDPILVNWQLLEKFSRGRLNELRYNPNSNLASADFADLMSALNDPLTGVLPWLSKHL
jgi:hypothetical protein